MTDQNKEFLMSFEDSSYRVPVLWIHGFPLNNLLWEPQIFEMADIARMIAPDLRGHGATESTDPPYSMELFSDDCARLLDHLGIKGPVVVGGLSMGGYVALDFYRRYPDRVAGLILAATRAGADSDEAKAARDKAAGQVIAEGVEAIVDAMLPKMLAPENYKREPELVEFLKDMMMETSEDGVVGALAAMRDRPDSTPLLDEIDIPVLIVHGEHDQLIPLSEAEVMNKALAGSDLVVIPEAGHLPNLENTEAFNDAVREFLERFYED